VREQLQGALLVRLPRALAERDEHGDPADQYVDDTPRREARSGQEVRRRAIGGPPGFAGQAGGGYGEHTRLYLQRVPANSEGVQPGLAPARLRDRTSCPGGGMRSWLAAVALATATAIVLAGCAAGPAGPRPGTGIATSS